MVADADRSIFWRGVLAVGALAGYAILARSAALEIANVRWPVVDTRGWIVPTAEATRTALGPWPNDPWRSSTPPR